MAATLIRAVEHVGPPQDPAADPGERGLAPEGDGLLVRLFGATPDYSRPEIDAVWKEVHASDPLEVYDYCRKQGIEVLNDNGEPVAPWRDIAVMLLARDRNLLG